MNKLVKKLNNKEGFTLVEMLIVVAIIAILIAVSIPLISSSLGKAKHATDAANERAAKAAALLSYMNGQLEGAATPTAFATDTTYIYDALSGMLKIGTTDSVAGYGKHHLDATGNPRVIILRVDADGNVKMQWKKEKTNQSSTTPDNSDICTVSEFNASGHALKAD